MPCWSQRCCPFNLWCVYSSSLNARWAKRYLGHLSCGGVNFSHRVNRKLTLRFHARSQRCCSFNLWCAYRISKFKRFWNIFSEFKSVSSYITLKLQLLFTYKNAVQWLPVIKMSALVTSANTWWHSRASPINCNFSYLAFKRGTGRILKYVLNN